MEYSMVGNRIKECRIKNNMTQLMLADMTGLSEASIYSYETGKRLPGLEAIVLMSNALKVSPDSLLYDYVDNRTVLKGKNIINKMNKLPEADRERILKIMDALIEAAE